MQILPQLLSYLWIRKVTVDAATITVHLLDMQVPNTVLEDFAQIFVCHSTLMVAVWDSHV
jgi:hypothetical protein